MIKIEPYGVLVDKGKALLACSQPSLWLDKGRALSGF
jgi:hypothetical protein